MILSNASTTARRLGRKAVKRDSRTLRLAKYITPALAPPPPSVDWSRGITDWGMMCNDTLGCCTIAGAAHAVQVFSANVVGEVTISDADIVGYYGRWDGYVVGDPTTDNGGIELDVLNNWKRDEFVGHQLIAYADVNCANDTQIRQAISLFGGLYIGFQVPNFVMQSFPAVWDVVPKDGGIDGGHCVFVVGYDDTTLSFISWGKVYKMTWAFWAKYVDEAHALLSHDFLSANGFNPMGFNLLQLQTDLECIK